MSNQINVINKKRAKQFFIGDRELLRDNRLSPDAKNIYHVLSSLAETCENVCPSHTWIASEIGYNTDVSKEDIEKYGEKIAKENKCRAINKWVASRIKELEELNMVRRIANIGTSYDYEVYDYYPVLKSTPPPSSKVPPTPSSEVPLEIRSENQDIECIVNMPSENSEIKKITFLSENENQKISDEKKRAIQSKLDLEDDLAERVFSLIELQFWNFYKDKGQKLANPDNQFAGWCMTRWSDIEKIKREVLKTKTFQNKNTHTSQNSTAPKKKYELIYTQYDNETLEQFEQRCSDRESQGDVYLKKMYNQTTSQSNKAQNLQAMKDAFIKQKTANYQ